MSSMAPATGPTGGGTLVTLTGGALESVNSVAFGGVPGTGLTIGPGVTSLTVTAPTGSVGGPVDVVTVSPLGNADAGDFTYVAPTLTGVAPLSANPPRLNAARNTSRPAQQPQSSGTGPTSASTPRTTGPASDSTS